jgi:hypothetical protein
MQKYSNKIFWSLSIIIIGIIFGLGVGLVKAWTDPTESPPNGNLPAPINVGRLGQTKTGGLILNTGGAKYGLIVATGSVGIGVTEPSEKLDVNGYVKGTGLCIGNDCRTAWPSGGGSGITSINGQTGPAITLSAGSGVTISTPSANNIQISATGSGGVGGSGTTNYISKWTSSSSLGNSIVYDNGTNVGIGTTNPSYKLDVNGYVKGTGLCIGNDCRTTWPSGGGSGGDSYWALSGSNIYNTNFGNVGIGTKTPSAKLDVAGRLALSGLESPGYGGASAGVAIIGTPNSGGGILFRPAGLDNTNDEVLFRSGVSYFSGNVGIGTTNPEYKLDVNGGTGLRGDLVLEGSNKWMLHTPDDGRTTLFIAPWGGTNWNWGAQTEFAKNGDVYFSRNVGIGTKMPLSKLTIGGQGDIEVQNGRILVKTPSYSGSILSIAARDIMTTNNEDLYLNWSNASGNVIIGGEGERKALYVAGPNNAAGSGSYIDAPDYYIRSIGKWASQLGGGTGKYCDGGIYTVKDYCVFTNPLTGACSCPSGYKAYKFLQTVSDDANSSHWRHLYQCCSF